jgi:O-antigen ligase
VVLALGVSIGAAVDRMAWGQEVYRWTVALALLVIASSAIKTVRHAWFVLIGVMAGVVGSTLFAAIQVATNDGPPSFQTGTLMRAYGAFGEPNPFAAYLEMSVLLLIPIALVTFRSRAGLAHFVPLIVVAMGVGALALTQSRGGMLGFAAGCAVIAWWYARWSRTLLLVAILFMVPMMLFTAPGRSVTERFTTSMATFRINEQTTPANWSVHERVAHWRAGLNMLEAEPVTGIGAGNFDARYREHTSVWRFRIPRGHAHNGFIQMGAQSGLIGLVAYLALFFVVGARAVRGIHRAQDHSARALALGSLGVLVAVTVHGQFDYLHGLSLNLAFVIALAMTNLSLRDECNALPPSGASS